MRHFLLSLPILLCLAACGGGAGGPADAPADDGAPLADLDTESKAEAELALLIDLIRALDVRDAAELANEIAFDLVRIDPGDPLRDRSDDVFPDPFTFDGFGDGERKDGLPAGAPPSGWGTGGLNSKNGTEDKDEFSGTVTWTWTTRDEHGTETTHTRTETADSRGRTSSHTSVTNTGGLEVTETRTRHANGTLQHERQVVDPSTGDGTYQAWSRTPDGRVLTYSEDVVDGAVQNSGVIPHPPRAWPVGEQPPLWLQDNPGDDGTVWWQQALADWVWRQHRLGRHTPRGTDVDPTRSNPEDPDYDGGLPTGPTVWDYVATGDLVINPDPTSPTLASHPPSGRAARILREIMRGMGQGVTPGPSTGGGGGR